MEPSKTLLSSLPVVHLVLTCSLLLRTVSLSLVVLPYIDLWTLCRHQLGFFMFSECVRVVISNGILPSVCGEQRIFLATTWVVYRFPWVGVLFA